jgi:hypothetical protein
VWIWILEGENDPKPREEISCFEELVFFFEKLKGLYWCVKVSRRPSKKNSTLLFL